jgi:tRNA U34 5-methylaminomethyl-2-thiouridine-forming methyltransferase MnmC
LKQTAIIKETADGSHTLYLPEMDETYHSIHGAKQESNFVFVNEGLKHLISNQPISNEAIKVFEVGFGTGLNAMLFAMEAIKLNRDIYFESIEKFPLDPNLISQLSYFILNENYFKDIHLAKWDESIFIHDRYELHKIAADLLEFIQQKEETFDLVLMDAFAPDKQSEMWSLEIFQKLFRNLKPGGILVTYSAKGDVKRAMRETGFVVKRIDGPPGKKHMLRAQKPNNETI